jgi:DNA-binding MarR family transcriptional regulator
MPIDLEEFERSEDEELKKETNADRVLRFLWENSDKAFTQSEIREGTGVKRGSASVVLSRLEDAGLVRHKGNYWAVGDEDRVASEVSFVESAKTANERFGEEDMDEWLEHAVEGSDEDEEGDEGDG